MKKIPFVKYTSCGNNFVIVDEYSGQMLSEIEKSNFAYKATNSCFGIGCDNLLVIQRCSLEVLAAINHKRHYWETLPGSTAPSFIFRMFEPNGEEALCCGNGLLCIANYLYHRYGIDEANIMTEIPFSTPNVISIGTKDSNGLSWVNLGYPRRVPPEVAKPSILIPSNEQVDFLEELRINFRTHDLTPFTDQTSLSLSGYLVFTGEPHFVVFPDSNFLVPELKGIMFVSPTQKANQSSKIEKRINFGSWLVHQIGAYINKHYLNYFPTGLSINFVNISDDTDAVEYRCFERGVNRETLACGTGALAVAYVVRHLNLLTKRDIDVLPYRCRLHEPHARIQVEETENGWWLKGNPSMLLEGTFMLACPEIKQQTDLSFHAQYAGQINTARKAPEALSELGKASQPDPTTRHAVAN